jgi:hypothetical protein
MRLLSSCFPLVLAFLAAAVLAAPAGPCAGPDRTASATSAGQPAGSQQPGSSATVHLDADRAAAVPVAAIAAARTPVAAGASQALSDTGSRAPAAPRGPPYLFA